RPPFPLTTGEDAGSRAGALPRGRPPPPTPPTPLAPPPPTPPTPLAPPPPATRHLAGDRNRRSDKAAPPDGTCPAPRWWEADAALPDGTSARRPGDTNLNRDVVPFPHRTGRPVRQPASPGWEVDTTDSGVC